jgi:hypothetical protein
MAGLAVLPLGVVCNMKGGWPQQYGGQMRGQGNQVTPFAICAVGFKGAEYLAGLIQGNCAPEAVFSYPQSDDVSEGFRRIAELCRLHGIPFESAKSPSYDELKPCFLVGWQYLMKNATNSVVVFHDSLLPKYRGFAPTVSALLRGEPQIGVTAIKPVADFDAGPIIAQSAAPISYPIRIKEALSLQAAMMAKLTKDILSRFQSALATAVEQDHAAATFSIWRDARDYSIDWTGSSAEVARMVDTLSFPYGGATARAGDQILVVDAASEVDDLVFPIRHPGKVWRLDDGRPIVICGTGMVRLDRVLTTDGEVYRFDRLRVRLT